MALAQMRDSGGTGTGEETSMWSSIGNWMGDNKDILASLAGKYADYEKQMADNRAQAGINQAAAKWSGFQPSLLNMVKPINNPNPVAMGMEAVATAPKLWYDIGQLYDARKAAKEGDNTKMENIKKQQMTQSILDQAFKNIQG